MLQEIAAARETELRLSARKIEHSMEWEQIFKIERLERALRLARVRLRTLPTLSAEPE